MGIPWQQYKNQYCIDNSNCECIDNGAHFCTKNIGFTPLGYFPFNFQISYINSNLQDFLKNNKRSILTGNGFTIFNLKDKQAYNWDKINERTQQNLQQLLVYPIIKKESKNFDISKHQVHLRSGLKWPVYFFLKNLKENNKTIQFNELFPLSFSNNVGYGEQIIKLTMQEILIIDELLNYDYDLSWGYETLLFMNDLLDTSNPQLKNITPYNSFRYLYSNSMKDAIWNNGFFYKEKIIDNSINLLKYDELINSKVFTFNFDPITKKVFKKCHHINGSFDYVIKTKRNYKKYESKPINTIGEYLSDFELCEIKSYWLYCLKNDYATSIVLKNAIYKERHKLIVCNFKEFYDSKDEFLNDDSALLIFGCSLINDITYWNFLFNNNRKIYFVYYKKTLEEAEEYLKKIEWMSYLYTGRNLEKKCKMYLIDFNEVDEFLKNI